MIHEQFNALNTMSTRPDHVGSFQMVDEELKRRGYHTIGVREAVGRGWEKHKLAEQQYAEVIDRSNLACRRSDLTTDESFKLYSSYFDDSEQLSRLDLTYMVGEQPPAPGGRGRGRTTESVRSPREKQQPGADESKQTFVEKAAKMGISIRSQAAYTRSRLPPLFSPEQVGRLPEGFEQINEDLFARRENKFMVLNGPGVETWQGAEAQTKVMSLDRVRTMLDALGQSEGIHGAEEKMD